MGYYMECDISFYKEDKLQHIGTVAGAIMSECPELIEILGCDIRNYNTDTVIVTEMAKWYDREDELTVLSTVLSDTYIEVKCTGEDNDVWTELYFNGRMVVDEPIYPDYFTMREMFHV